MTIALSYSLWVKPKDQGWQAVGVPSQLRDMLMTEGKRLFEQGGYEQFKVVISGNMPWW